MQVNKNWKYNLSLFNIFRLSDQYISNKNETFYSNLFFTEMQTLDINATFMQLNIKSVSFTGKDLIFENSKIVERNNILSLNHMYSLTIYFFFKEINLFETFGLASCAISSDALNLIFGDIGSNKVIKNLLLININIDSIQYINLLNALKKNNYITKLSLIGIKITDTKLSALANILKTNHNISFQNISANDITDVSYSYITDILLLTGVNHLIISGNNISAPKIELINKTLRLNKINATVVF